MAVQLLDGQSGWTLCPIPARVWEARAQLIIYHHKQPTTPWLNWFWHGVLDCTVAFIVSSRFFFFFFYGGAAGCIDATLCPGSGQIVSINPEIGGLCPIRWRSGQSGRGSSDRMSGWGRGLNYTSLWDCNFRMVAETIWRIFTQIPHCANPVLPMQEDANVNL